MVVALTVGLAVASRTITNLRIVTDNDNSQRALSAAEAGIERAVKSPCTAQEGCPLTGAFSANNASFTTTITPILSSEFLMKAGIQIKQAEGADVWLSDYSDDPLKIYANPRTGNVSIYWGQSTDGCSDAGMEIIVISGDIQSPIITKYAVDACQQRRSATNFCPKAGGGCPTWLGSGGNIAGRDFKFGTVIPVTSGILMRVIPVFYNATIGVKAVCDASGNCSTPLQGNIIDSVGSAGGTQRKISFFKSFASIPTEYFQYSLLSPEL